MERKSDPPPPRDLVARAEAALAAGRARIQRIEVEGRFYWVKSQERLRLRMRLQKGNPGRAFEAERQAMHELASAGLPVPPILAEAPGYFVIPDCGRPLSHLLRDPDLGPASRLPAFSAAATGLAGFHAKGFSHGRPSIKDICWDGEKASFLDLERFAARRNTPAGHVEDLVILLFSAFAETGRRCPETDALAAAYRAADPGGIWQGAERLCSRLGWTGPLSWPVRKLRRSKDFRAIPLTLEAFRRH